MIMVPVVIINARMIMNIVIMNIVTVIVMAMMSTSKFS